MSEVLKYYAEKEIKTSSRLKREKEEDLKEMICRECGKLSAFVHCTSLRLGPRSGTTQVRKEDILWVTKSCPKCFVSNRKTECPVCYSLLRETAVKLEFKSEQVGLRIPRKLYVCSYRCALVFGFREKPSNQIPCLKKTREVLDELVGKDLTEEVSYFLESHSLIRVEGKKYLPNLEVVSCCSFCTTKEYPVGESTKEHKLEVGGGSTLVEMATAVTSAGRMKIQELLASLDRSKNELRSAEGNPGVPSEQVDFLKARNKALKLAANSLYGFGRS